MLRANECREVMIILFIIVSIVCLFVLFFQLRGLSQLCKSVSLNIIRLKSTTRPTHQFKDTLINYCFVF